MASWWRFSRLGLRGLTIDIEENILTSWSSSQKSLKLGKNAFIILIKFGMKSSWSTRQRWRIAYRTGRYRQEQINASAYRNLLRVPPLLYFAIPGSRTPFHKRELELWTSSLSQQAQSVRGFSTLYTLDDLRQLWAKGHTLYFFSLPEGPPSKASVNQRRTSPTFLTCTANSAWQDV